jgi:hypothetical protein
MDFDIITDISMLEEDTVLFEQETMIRVFVLRIETGWHMENIRNVDTVMVSVKPEYFRVRLTNQCGY